MRKYSNTSAAMTNEFKLESKAMYDSGDEADDESMSDARPNKKRLIVGDGDGSFTRALITKHKQKHPRLARAIVTTELDTEQNLKEVYASTFPDNLKFLQENKVQYHFKVDGTKLHEDFRFHGERFPRIHWNYPHDKSSFLAQTLPPIIAGFFRSAAQLQRAGDRIHVTLPKLPNMDKERFYQGYVYGIFDAAAKQGYQLMKSRGFNSTRYPGYKHVVTGQSRSASVADEGREYIFKKTHYTYQELTVLQPPRQYTAYEKTVNCLPQIDTDNESSSYEDDEVTVKQVFQAAKNGNQKVIETYLKQGGDINVRDPDTGLSLLFTVISDFHFNDDLAVYLIESGIDVSGIIFEKISSETYHFEIASGAFYFNTNALQCAYLYQGFSSKTFQKLLVHTDMDLNARCHDSIQEDIIHLAERRYPNNDGRGYNSGYSLDDAALLHYAAIEGDFAAVKALCATKHVNLNARASVVHNKHLFSRNICDGCSDEPITLPSGIEFLGNAWECAFPVSITRVNQVTPAHLAALAGHKEIMEFLIEQGADAKAEDSMKRSPLQVYDALHKVTHEMDVTGDESPSVVVDSEHSAVKAPSLIGIMAKNFMGLTQKVADSSEDTMDERENSEPVFAQ